MTSAPSTPLDLDRLEKIAQAATPGPWTCEKPCVEQISGFSNGVAVAATYGRQMIYANPPGGSFPAADQRHIAAFDPPTALTLIDAVRESASLRAELEAVKTEADDQAQTIERLSVACGEQTIKIASLRDQLEAITKERDELLETVENQEDALYSVSVSVGQMVQTELECAYVRAELKSVKELLELIEQSEKKEIVDLRTQLAAASARERTLIGLLETTREALGILADFAPSGICHRARMIAFDAREALTKLNEAAK